LLVHSKESNQIRSVALVQIRCVEFVFSTGQNQGAFVLTTGCGVVGASRLEQEQKEIQLKRLATLSRLGLV
jgi:isochorismate synthase EntC